MHLKIFLCSCVSLSVLSAASAQAADITDVGDLPGGVISNNPLGISADGTTIIGYSTGGSGQEAYYWTLGGGIIGLGDLPGGTFTSLAAAINADDTVIAGYGQSAGGNEAFRWTSGSGMVGLGDLAGGFFYSTATGISADGNIIVGSSHSGAFQAYRWTSGTGMVGLGDLPGGLFQSFASAISADGSTIVGLGTSASGPEAFRWTSGTGMVGLGDLAGGIFQSTAQGVNDDGSTIVGFGFSASGQEAYSWTSGTGMIGLGDLPGGLFASSASAVNADGSVIIGFGTDASGQRAMRWTSGGGMESLADILTADGVDLTGIVLEEAVDMDDSGNLIAVEGTNNGNAAGFLVNLATAGITTPGNLVDGLLPATIPARQLHSIFNNNLGQSLLAATQTFSSLDVPTLSTLRTNDPAAISPAAGDEAILLPRRWSAYAIGSFGWGQDNDTDNHDINGTTGIMASVNDNWAVGLGILSSSGTIDLANDGDSSVRTMGGSVVTAYEGNNGLRFYGAAFAAVFDASIDRRYINGAGIDGSRGKTDGMGYGAALRAGYELPASQIALMPYGEIEASKTKLDSYTETGGGFPAAFDDQDSHQVTSRLGAQISYNVTPALTIGARAAWAHRISDTGGDLNVSTTGFTGTLGAAEGDKNWGEATLTTRWQASPGTTLSAELTGRSGRTQEPMGTATIGLSIAF